MRSEFVVIHKAVVYVFTDLCFFWLKHFAMFHSAFSLLPYDCFFRTGKRAKTVKDFVASSGSSSPVRERGGLSLSAVKSLVLGEKEDKLGFDAGDEEKLVSLINALFNVGKFALDGVIFLHQPIFQLQLFIFPLFVTLPNYFYR